MVTIHSTFELAAAERSFFFLIMMCQNREFVVTKIGMWYGYHNITFIRAAIDRSFSLLFVFVLKLRTCVRLMTKNGMSCGYHNYKFHIGKQHRCRAKRGKNFFKNFLKKFGIFSIFPWRIWHPSEKFPGNSRFSRVISFFPGNFQFSRFGDPLNVTTSHTFW